MADLVANARITHTDQDRAHPGATQDHPPALTGTTEANSWAQVPSPMGMSFKCCPGTVGAAHLGAMPSQGGLVSWLMAVTSDWASPHV